MTPNNISLRLLGGSEFHSQNSNLSSNYQSVVNSPISQNYLNDIPINNQEVIIDNPNSILAEPDSRESNNSIFQDPFPDDLNIYFHNVRSVEKRHELVDHIVTKYNVDSVILLECLNRPKETFFGNGS